MAAKTFYLSFDGAPNPPGTDNVLAALARHEVKAAFFMEGRRLEDQAECARRVLAAGHDIGNHSYNHPEFDTVPLEVCIEEVEKTDQILFEKLGIQTRLLRPPAGRLTPQVEREFLRRGYDIVLWSYSIKDWIGPAAAAVAERVLSQARDQAIIVFHDRVEWVPQTLDFIIPRLKEQGYQFKKISESGRSGVIR